MPKSPNSNAPSKAIAITGIIGGTLIAVLGPAITLYPPGGGTHGFVLALIAMTLGASAVITAVTVNKR